MKFDVFHVETTIDIISQRCLMMFLLKHAKAGKHNSDLDNVSHCWWGREKNFVSDTVHFLPTDLRRNLDEDKSSLENTHVPVWTIMWETQIWVIRKKN